MADEARLLRMRQRRGAGGAEAHPSRPRRLGRGRSASAVLAGRGPGAAPGGAPAARGGAGGARERDPAAHVVRRAEPRHRGLRRGPAAARVEPLPDRVARYPGRRHPQGRDLRRPHGRDRSRPVRERRPDRARCARGRQPGGRGARGDVEGRAQFRVPPHHAAGRRGLHPHGHRRHRAAPGRGAVAAGAEDGGGRPADRRRRA